MKTVEEDEDEGGGGGGGEEKRGERDRKLRYEVS